MNTWSIKHTVFFTLFCSCVLVRAQQLEARYVQPQVLVSHQASENYDVYFGVSSRRNTNAQSSRSPMKFYQLSHFSAFRLENNNKISLGVLYRFSEHLKNGSPNELRLTQQFHTASKPFAVRYTHRFRIEERLTAASVRTRLRYRLGIDFSLNGASIDVGEAYTLFHAESLLQLAKNQFPRYDFRASTGLGVVLSPTLKIQAMLQHRFEQLSRAPSNTWLGVVAGYIKI